MNKTKVALVFPKRGDIFQGMPLAFGCLKSNTDNNKYNFQLVDCTLDDMDFNSPEFVSRIEQINPDVVGVTSWSVNFYDALMLIKSIKKIKPEIVTIFGGPHATTNAEDAIKNKEIDFIFRGEAELSFSNFLDELKKTIPDFSKIKGLGYRDEQGKVVLNEIARVQYLDDIKIPDYNFINIDRYIKGGYSYQGIQKRNAPIWTTRGCPYRCNFCTVPSVSGKIVRKHSIEYLVEWVKYLYQHHEIRGFNIVDDNFTYDKDYAKAFCKAIIKLGYKNISFNAPNGIRMQRGDAELWRLMRQSGWYTVVVAPETGSERMLKLMKKDLDREKVPMYIKEIKKSGLKVHGFFMIGYPGETDEDVRKTEMLIKKGRFDDLSITAFQPLPGTPIYNELIEKKEISDDFKLTFFMDHKKLYLTPGLKNLNLGAFVQMCRLRTILHHPKKLLMPRRDKGYLYNVLRCLGMPIRYLRYFFIFLSFRKQLKGFIN